jgi:hypothetical protein
MEHSESATAFDSSLVYTCPPSPCCTAPSLPSTRHSSALCRDSLFLPCGPAMSWSVCKREIPWPISSNSVDSFRAAQPGCPQAKTPVPSVSLRRSATQASRGSSDSRAKSPDSPALGHGGGAVRIPPPLRRRHRCVKPLLPFWFLLCLVPSFSLPGFLIPIVRGVAWVCMCLQVRVRSWGRPSTATSAASKVVQVLLRISPLRDSVV